MQIYVVNSSVSHYKKVYIFHLEFFTILQYVIVKSKKNTDAPFQKLDFLY